MTALQWQFQLKPRTYMKSSPLKMWGTPNSVSIGRAFFELMQLNFLPLEAVMSKNMTIK